MLGWSGQETIRSIKPFDTSTSIRAAQKARGREYLSLSGSPSYWSQNRSITEPEGWKAVALEPKSIWRRFTAIPLTVRRAVDATVGTGEGSSASDCRSFSMLEVRWSNESY